MAAVAIGVPLVGELEMSLPPWDVPTSAEPPAVPVNVGVRLTVAPKSGFVLLAVRLAVAAAITLTVAVALAVDKALLLAVSVQVCGVAGAVQVVL